MKSQFVLGFLCLLILSCSTTKKETEVLPPSPPVPIMTFDKETIDIGDIKRGDTRAIEYIFTNTGNADLEIELVTACKCTSTDWTRGIIAPGERGKLSVVFDSKDQKLGELGKTIDIIANTDPIVVECFFVGNIVR
ncbi:MAG: DUF1573 domain-containing protein [Bacteroidia bacterium]|nr:DUF1573 domain-containing protein [Bacteroidia bacterium]